MLFQLTGPTTRAAMVTQKIEPVKRKNFLDAREWVSVCNGLPSSYLSASGNVTYRTGCLSDNTCAGVGGPGNPLSQLFVVNGQNWQNFVSALNIWVMFWNETGTTLRTDEPLPCVTPFRVTLFPSPDTTGPPLTTPAPTPCPTPVPALPGLQSWQIIMIALNACLGVLMLGLLAAGFYFCPRRAAYEHIQ